MYPPLKHKYKVSHLNMNIYQWSATDVVGDHQKDCHTIFEEEEAGVLEQGDGTIGYNN